MTTQDKDEELCLDGARSIAEGKSNERYRRTEEIRTKKEVRKENEGSRMRTKKAARQNNEKNQVNGRAAALRSDLGRSRKSGAANPERRQK
jgi:hypothetical protein